MSGTTNLGNLLRINPLPLSALPAHPALNGDESSASNRPSLSEFTSAALDEGTALVSSIDQKFKARSWKSSPPSSSKVQLFSRTVTASELSKVPWTAGPVPRQKPAPGDNTEEAWFARRSYHANDSNTNDAASYSEFEEGLLEKHSEHEKEYTPDVYDAYEVLRWDVPAENIGKYSHVNMRVVEMAHHIPAPLANRVFSVVVVTAKTSDTSFLVVQIPVDIRSLSGALYSNDRHLREGDTSIKRKKVILGVYASVEGVTLRHDNDRKDIEWIMGTTSDAKGWLPMSMQKMGVPGAVVKDVGLFLAWVKKQREKKQTGTG
ncbi:hypothetical protein L228DRAFT_265236 [Xylona heveae TC161]|uniref:DUF3074 domain-containing protein n=1 Tax=Xylona heveae (strain CBS 132557 / TC161) TaxID=1328760 RepID=A0A165K1J3_XYLHT|nr:hypothetical protein L228DRAFT_265236 [Xylona heveae TC161]KZF26884.1 hypothetical protein L228DRAFT_265236 [Xylona heveae TC161]